MKLKFNLKKIYRLKIKYLKTSLEIMEFFIFKNTKNLRRKNRLLLFFYILYLIILIKLYILWA